MVARVHIQHICRLPYDHPVLSSRQEQADWRGCIIVPRRISGETRRSPTAHMQTISSFDESL